MPVDMDGDLENADWTKKTWDLAPYGSPEFFQQIGGIDKLESFKKLPVYKHACDAGLIHDDEWVGDYVQTEGGNILLSGRNQ